MMGLVEESGSRSLIVKDFGGCDVIKVGNDMKKINTKGKKERCMRKNHVVFIPHFAWYWRAPKIVVNVIKG